jgi:hypothetical protein
MKSKDNQVDLFELTKKEIENYLHVMSNGNSINVNYSDLFDYKKYDTLLAVTYVSSPSFFSKVIRGYEKVEIILGIDNADINRSFAEGAADLLMAKGSDFFKGLDNSIKEKVVNNYLNVRYADLGTLIHSKIYLLSNSKTGTKRVVIGSANLTESAFNNDIPQYEDVIVFDEENIYKLYLSRYQAIHEKTIDFIPEKAKAKFKAEKAYYIDDEERVEMIIEQLSKKGGTIVIPEEITESLQLATDKNDKNNVEYQFTTKIINQVTRKKDTKLTLKTPVELFKIKPIIKEIIFQQTKVAKDITRFSLHYNEYERRIDCQKPFEDRIVKSISYCRSAEPQEVKESLQLIDKFINAYSMFTTNPDESNLSKVYEVILYAFMSVFLFKVREDYGLEVGKPEKREDIPVFLIIGGRAKSGKSSLLTFISRLLSNSSSSDYLQYKDIDKTGILDGLFNESNIFPILVDEMSEKFFNSTAKSKGEIFIKHIANSLDGKHPALITTTNTRNFNVPEQVLRRVYYLQIDKTFDDSRKSEADAYYLNLVAQINQTLVMDFCLRVCELIRSGGKLYRDSSDCLWLARELFKDYYKIAGLKLPEYFPLRPFNDYKIRGKNMWRTLLTENPGIFRYSPDEDQLTVTLTGAMNDAEKQNYLNYIDVACVKEDMGLHTLLRASTFFKWLEAKNPFVKKKKWWFFG